MVRQPEVWEEFLKIERIADVMKEAWGIITEAGKDGEEERVLDATRLPPNVEHCSAYGGCPYQDNCNLSPMDKLKSYAAQDKIRTQVRKADEDTSKKDPRKGENMNPLLEKLKKQREANGVNGAAAVEEAGPAINPPENATMAATLAQMALLPSDVETQPAPPHLDPPTKRGPGRPKKGASTAQQVRDGIPPGPHAPTPESIAEAQVRFSEKQPILPNLAMTAAIPLPSTLGDIKIGVLYINCGPIGPAAAQVMDAGFFIQNAKKRLKAEKNLADYRFAEFGHGPGMLAMATAAEVDAAFHAAVRIDTTTPEGACVLMELQSRAAFVVR
jgi:hypothetical protein